jgi:hypothetical protein
VNEVTVVVQLRVNNSRGSSTRTRERIGTRSTEGDNWEQTEKIGVQCL